MLQQKTFSKIGRNLVVFGIVLGGAWLAVESGAQETAPAADPLASEAAPAVPPTGTLWDKIVASGWFMVPIAFLSVWALTLTVFCALQISVKKFVPPRLANDILGNMADVRVRTAIDRAAQDSSFLGRMVSHSYPNVDATQPETLGKTKVEDAILDFTARENSRYMMWISYFSVIAQAAPMIGLFGTVGGMIMAFDTMGLSKGADPGALAGSISLALITTAAGLVVAIPSIFAYSIFKNRLNKLVSQAQEVALEGLDLALATVNADEQLAKIPEGVTEA